MLESIFYTPYLQLSTVDKPKPGGTFCNLTQTAEGITGYKALWGWRTGDTRHDGLKSSCHQFPSQNLSLGKSEYFPHFHILALSWYITSTCSYPSPLSSWENQGWWEMVCPAPWKSSSSPLCSTARFRYTLICELEHSEHSKMLQWALKHLLTLPRSEGAAHPTHFKSDSEFYFKFYFP